MKTLQIHPDGRVTKQVEWNFYQFGLNKTGAIVVFRPKHIEIAKAQLAYRSAKSKLPDHNAINTDKVTVPYVDIWSGLRYFQFTKKYDENGNCIGWE